MASSEILLVFYWQNESQFFSWGQTYYFHQLRCIEICKFESLDSNAKWSRSIFNFSQFWQTFIFACLFARLFIVNKQYFPFGPKQCSHIRSWIWSVRAANSFPRTKLKENCERYLISKEKHPNKLGATVVLIPQIFFATARIKGNIAWIFLLVSETCTSMSCV